MTLGACICVKLVIYIFFFFIIFGMVCLLFIEMHCVVFLNKIKKGINISVGSCLYVFAISDAG